jgi:hypothetical protein
MRTLTNQRLNSVEIVRRYEWFHPLAKVQN